MLKGPFTVSYDLQGGVGETPSFKVFEGEIPLPKTDDPTKEHFEFLGWALTKTAAEFIDKYFSVIDANVVIYANWLRIDFLATFNSDGGIGEMAQMFVPIDKTTGTGILTFPKSGFEKLHFTFDGWKTDATGDTVYQPGDELIISNDITITAVWKLTDCVIHLISTDKEIAIKWEEVIAYAPLYGEYLIPGCPSDWELNPDLREFAGWKVDGAGSRLTEGSKLNVNGRSEITLVIDCVKIRHFVPATQEDLGVGKIYYIFGYTSGDDIEPWPYGQWFTATVANVKRQVVLSKVNFDVLAARILNNSVYIKKSRDEVVLRDNNLNLLPLTTKSVGGKNWTLCLTNQPSNVYTGRIYRSGRWNGNLYLATDAEKANDKLPKTVKQGIQAPAMISTNRIQSVVYHEYGGTEFVWWSDERESYIYIYRELTDEEIVEQINKGEG